MKAIKPIGVEHLQPGQSSTSLITGRSLFALWDIYTIKTNSAYMLTGLFVQDGQIRFGLGDDATGGSANGMAQISNLDMWGDRSDFRVCVFGFRYKPGNKPGVAQFGVRLVRLTADQSANPDNILLSIPANSPEGYYEIVIRPYLNSGTTYGVAVYKDGDLISSPGIVYTLTASSFKTAFFCIGSAASTMMLSSGALRGDYTFSMEDMYIAWSNVGDEDIRLGPIRVKRIPYVEVDPGAWTPVGGKTPKDILNLAGNAGTLRTDYLTSDPLNTSVKCKLDVSVLRDNDRVVALGVSSSAWRDGGTVGNLGVKWKHPDGETAPTTYSPTNSTFRTQLDVLNPTLITTPGGAALTKTSLAALELVVTPSP